MKVNRIHLRARGDAAVDWQLAFYPGYTVVLAPGPEAASRLASMLTALLYPEPGIASLPEWSASEPITASVAVDIDGDAFLVAADFAAHTIDLSSYDKESGRYDPACSGAADVARRLRSAGLPGREVFQALCTRGFPMPAVREAPDEEPQQAAAVPMPSTTDVRSLDMSSIEARVAELRQARERAEALDDEYRQAFEKLEEHAALSSLVEDSEFRLTAFRKEGEELEKARERIRRERRSQLDLRSKLTPKPAAQILPICVGLVLGVSGIGVGYGGTQGGWLFAAVGSLLAAAATTSWLMARRGLERCEAALASLHVRERTAERKYETAVASVRNVLQKLELDTIEDLETELAGFSDREKELDGLHKRVTEARNAFSAEAFAELAQLEDLLERPERVPRFLPETEAAPPPPEPGIDEAFSFDPTTPDGLIDAAATCSDLPRTQLVERLVTKLPEHLHALTAEYFDHAESDGSGWVLRGEDGEQEFDDLSPGAQDTVMFAFQLALLEALSTERAFPLLIGPALKPADDDDARSLARAMSRVGAALQILHVTSGADLFSDHAARTISL